MSVPKKKQIEDNEQNLCEQDPNSFSGMIPEPTGPTVIAFFAKEVYNKSLSDSG